MILLQYHVLTCHIVCSKYMKNGRNINASNKGFLSESYSELDEKSLVEPLKFCIARRTHSFSQPR